jgi:hypothetical protein
MRLGTLGLMVAACGGGGGGGGPAPAIAGIYTIEHHTRSEAAPGGAPATCLGEGPDVTAFSHLRIAEHEFGGLEWGVCTSADPASCDDQFYTFDDIDGVWDIGPANSAAYSGGLCTLYHAEARITVIGEAPLRVRLEIREWHAYPDGPQEDCEEDAATAIAGDETYCTEHRVIEATAI